MILKSFLIHNWWAILFFNFKMLPFKQAVHLPFDFYGKVRFVNLSGSINLRSKKLKVGMIKIGAQGTDMFPKSETILNIKGDVTIEDRLVLGMGSSLISLSDSTLRFGRNAIIGAKNLIYCEKSITFGDNFLTSWDYTCHGENCVLAGSPAKVVSTNKRWEL